MAWTRRCSVNLLFIQLAAVFMAFHFESAQAIDCFVCDSSVEPKCADLKAGSGIKPEPCTLDKMRSINTWLFELNKISYLNSTPELKNIPMNCQKVVAQRKGDKEVVTARFCQLDTRDTDACSILAEKVEPDEMKFCSICSTDRCNGASGQQVLSLFSSLASLVLLLKIVW